jgi:hypothetical protein
MGVFLRGDSKVTLQKLAQKLDRLPDVIPAAVTDACGDYQIFLGVSLYDIDEVTQVPMFWVGFDRHSHSGVLYTAHRHSALAVPDVQNLSQQSCQRRRRSADAHCTKSFFWTLPKSKDSLGWNAPAIDYYQPTPIRIARTEELVPPFVVVVNQRRMKVRYPLPK